MAKFNFENKYFWMFLSEDFVVEYDFTNNMASGETLSSCVASIVDSDGTDQTSTMIADKAVSTPDVTFTVQNPPAVNVYEIKLVGTSNNSKNYTAKIICDVYGSATLNTKLGDPSANSYVTLKEANDYIRNTRGHPNAWDTLSIEGRKRVLMEACSDINRYNFVEERYYDAQTLEFPRDDHDVITGDCATPLTSNSFKNTSFTSDTYGGFKSNTNYWKYGTVHITEATPLYDIRQISSSDITTDVVTVDTNFTATPTVNTSFTAFEPLDKSIKEAQIEQALYILENSGSGTLYGYRSAGANRVRIGDVEVQFKDGATKRIALSSVSRKLLSPWVRRTKKLLRA